MLASNRWIPALALALALAMASAQTAPTPAAMMFAPDGTIVGIGYAGADGAVELQVLAEFAGPATLLLTPDAGDPRTVMVIVEDGVVAPRDAADADALAGLRSVATRGLPPEADGGPTLPPQAKGTPGPPAEPPGQARPDPQPRPETPPSRKPDDAGASGRGNAGR